MNELDDSVHFFLWNVFTSEQLDGHVYKNVHEPFAKSPTGFLCMWRSWLKCRLCERRSGCHRHQNKHNANPPSSVGWFVRHCAPGLENKLFRRPIQIIQIRSPTHFEKKVWWQGVSESKIIKTAISSAGVPGSIPEVVADRYRTE